MTTKGTDISKGRKDLLVGLASFLCVQLSG